MLKSVIKLSAVLAFLGAAQAFAAPPHRPPQRPPPPHQGPCTFPCNHQPGQPGPHPGPGPGYPPPHQPPPYHPPQPPPYHPPQPPPYHPPQPPPPYYPPPQNNQVRLSLSVYRTLGNGQGIEILRSLGMNRYYGYRLVSLTVNGRSANNQVSTLRAYVNGGFSIGQASYVNYSESKTLYFNGAYYVGRNLTSLDLINQGLTSVSYVEAILVR